MPEPAFASAGPFCALTQARDTITMIDRGIRLSRRNIEAMFTALMLPVALMLMFVYLFGGALSVGTAYVDYVVPGVIALCAGFGSATTAVSISQDMKSGIVDRFRSMDIGAVAMIAGHVAASVLRNLASTVLIFVVAIAIGFRPHASVLGWLVVFGLLAAFMVAISWIAAATGLLASSPEAANGFSFFVMFLPYASSAFVPIGTMPSWLRGFAGHQPCTPLIESVRALLAGHGAGSHTVTALGWCAVILVVAMALSALAFRRKTR
ncbi:ABC transporter permease [Nocardia abscessus]|uniref:ABC transporter permease n=1 Tax=Nocardia abscessus TaxID=120957 RepID=UPI00245631EB|nr:ABC transporter permease [Nocardia abscessus]